jgi:hypothetical protein
MSNYGEELNIDSPKITYIIYNIINLNVV